MLLFSVVLTSTVCNEILKLDHEHFFITFEQTDLGQAFRKINQSKTKQTFSPLSSQLICICMAKIVTPCFAIYSLIKMVNSCIIKGNIDDKVSYLIFYNFQTVSLYGQLKVDSVYLGLCT